MSKVLLISPWDNCWVNYIRKYFVDRGHHLDFKSKIELKEVQDYDALICGWSDNYAKALGDFPKLCKKYICYLRSYEYYHGFFRNIQWNNFDHLFFINSHIMGAFRSCYKGEKLPDISLTKNGIDLENIEFKTENKKNVLMLANINHKKGIQLFVQIARKMPDYKFFIAGNIQEARFGDYLLNLAPGNIELIGYQNDINKLFKNMGYIICCSPAEGNPNCIIEGMAAGLKPIVYRFLGSDGQFPYECYFDTVEGADILIRGDYEPKKYRKWIEDNYDMNVVYEELGKCVIGDTVE